MKSNVRQAINEIKLMLNNHPKYMLEQFMMPPEGYEDEPIMPQQEEEVEMPQVAIDDVSEEINQIRQISIQAIARLAENPQSKSYMLMKKIWNMCDKFCDPQKDGDLEE